MVKIIAWDYSQRPRLWSPFLAEKSGLPLKIAGAKPLQFSHNTNFYYIKNSISSPELMTKFHEDTTKMIDFLLTAFFELCPIFYASPSMYLITLYTLVDFSLFQNNLNYYFHRHQCPWFRSFVHTSHFRITFTSSDLNHKMSLTKVVVDVS